MLALKKSLIERQRNWLKSITFTPGQVTALSISMIMSGITGGLYWLYLILEEFF